MFNLSSVGGRKNGDEQDPLVRELRQAQVEALKAKAKYYEAKTKLCEDRQEETAARCSLIDALTQAVGLWCAYKIAAAFDKAADGGWALCSELVGLIREREVAQAKADVARAKFSEEKGKNGGYRGQRRDVRRPAPHTPGQEVRTTNSSTNGSGQAGFSNHIRTEAPKPTQ